MASILSMTASSIRYSLQLRHCRIGKSLMMTMELASARALDSPWVCRYHQFISGDHAMTTAQAILKHLKGLPDSAQQEVLDFVKFLESRQAELGQREEEIAWSHFSLTSALRDMEDEETPYTLADLKESF